MKQKQVSPLSIVYQRIDQLKPFANNARTHSKSQIRQIADSIRVFGFTNPVLVDRDNRIIAGHGRVEGAKLEGISEVPTIRLEDLSQDEIRAYVIADNKLAENAGWDKSILANELQHLSIVEGLDFNVTITGFDVPEIDVIIEDQHCEQREDPDDNLPSISGELVTEPGDLWQLGKHRIMCGSGGLLAFGFPNSAGLKAKER
jgi:hypothetical protein